MSTATKATATKPAAVKVNAVKVNAVKVTAVKVTAVKAKPVIKIQPLEDRVVILPADEAEAMHGPLYIPDTAKEKPTRGEVLAVGPGQIVEGVRVKMDIGVGDTVIYGKYSGTPYQAGDDELIIIKASDILAKIG
jgi:chaperonin GroES